MYEKQKLYESLEAPDRPWYNFLLDCYSNSYCSQTLTLSSKSLKNTLLVCLFSLPDLGVEVSMNIAGGLHRASLGASRSALETDFHTLGSGEVQLVAGLWILEALTSEFADLDVSLTTTCTCVGVRNGRAVAFPPFVPWPLSFELFSNTGGSAHAEQLLLWMICGPGLGGMQ